MRRGWPKAAGYHWDQAKPFVHPSNGRPSCRWCKGPVRPPKRNWCANPECLQAWLFRTRRSAFRAAVFERDKGVCCDCGLDCDALDAEKARGSLWKAADAMRPGRTRKAKPAGPGSLRPHLDRLAAALEWRVANNVPAREPAWQVDHVKPLCENGDPFDMANLLTRCVPCHRRKSASESKARKDALAAKFSNPKKPKVSVRKRKAV